MSEPPPIRAIIADDEPLARRGIRQLLARHADVVVVAEARNGREAVHLVRAHRPELVFLDVQMPEGDGFAVVRQLDSTAPPVIVFVTAYDDYAVRAFEVHALDYLVKPVTADRFAAALARARQRVRQAEAAALSGRLAALLAEQGLSAPAPPAATPAARTARLLVPTPSGERVLDVAEIDWIEAEDYYVAVHASGRRFLVRDSLASLERRLAAEHFVRVHRGALVNFDRVRELRIARTTDEATVVLASGVEIPVSRRRRAELEARLRARSR